jgi:hypothetical protein
VYVNVQGGPAEIENPTHCNLTGRSMNASLPVLSPSSILPPTSSHWRLHSLKEKFGARLKNMSVLVFKIA